MRQRNRRLVAAVAVAATLGGATVAGPAAAWASPPPPDAAPAGFAAAPEPTPAQEPSPPPPEPEPSADTSPPSDTSPPEAEEQPASQELAAQECGVFDYACKVREAFNGWLVEVIADAINAQLMATAAGLLVHPHPTAGITQAHQTALVVVNTGYVLMVTLGGVLLMTNPTVHTSASPAQLLPRIVLGWVGANASLLLCGWLTDAGNALALGLLGDAATPQGVATSIARLVANPRGEILLVLLLLVVAALLQMFVLLAMFARIMLWLLLTAIAPLALACHALPQTEGAARLWWRAMGALLAIQLGQALVLRIAVVVFLSREGLLMFDPAGTAGSIIDAGVLIGCLYVLVRIPFWAFRRVFNYQSSPIVKGAKLAASLVIFRHLGKALTRRSPRTPTPRTARGAPHSPRPRSTRVPVSPSRPRWYQPELPGVWPRVPHGRQLPLPGIDRQIDPAAQRRLRQRRRYLQPPLPAGEPSRPPWHRQDPLPGMEGLPRGRQDPIPNLKPAPRMRQDALFDPPQASRRRPSPHHSLGGQQQPQPTQRRAPTQPRAPHSPSPSQGGSSGSSPQPRSGPQRRPVRPTPRHSRYRRRRP